MLGYLSPVAPAVTASCCSFPDIQLTIWCNQQSVPSKELKLNLLVVMVVWMLTTDWMNYVHFEKTALHSFSDSLKFPWFLEGGRMDRHRGLNASMCWNDYLIFLKIHHSWRGGPNQSCLTKNTSCSVSKQRTYTLWPTELLRPLNATR